MLDVLVIGAGMIVSDQILPSLYHLQRLKQIGHISVAATSSTRLKHLVHPRFTEAFPNQVFSAYPPLNTSDSERNPELWRKALADLPQHNLVVVATPDETHDKIVHAALDRNEHVLCVKPLVHRYDQAVAIGRIARERGLLVMVEYHKRFDRRALEARKLYRQGCYGEFACGQACMIEPYYYRLSNFQNWFTKDKTDPFTYVGCHYVDLVYFITGLQPTEVSVRGVERPFPNKVKAYMWANGRVVFENGAILTVNTGLGYPDRGAGSNDQGLTMYCEGSNTAGLIQHNDQFRGVSYSFIDERFGAPFRHVNPDYFRLVPWLGPGLKPVGYGYDSIEAAVNLTLQLQDCGDHPNAVGLRQTILTGIDQAGLIATPQNSSINEKVIEAARRSILADGTTVKIDSIAHP